MFIIIGGFCFKPAFYGHPLVGSLFPIKVYFKQFGFSSFNLSPGNFFILPFKYFFSLTNPSYISTVYSVWIKCNNIATMDYYFIFNLSLSNGTNNHTKLHQSSISVNIILLKLVQTLSNSCATWIYLFACLLLDKLLVYY